MFTQGPSRIPHTAILYFTFPGCQASLELSWRGWQCRLQPQVCTSGDRSKTFICERLAGPKKGFIYRAPISKFNVGIFERLPEGLGRPPRKPSTPGPERESQFDGQAQQDGKSEHSGQVHSPWRSIRCSHNQFMLTNVCRHRRLRADLDKFLQIGKNSLSRQKVE